MSQVLGEGITTVTFWSLITHGRLYRSQYILPKVIARIHFRYKAIIYIDFLNFASVLSINSIFLTKLGSALLMLSWSASCK